MDDEEIVEEIIVAKVTAKMEVKLQEFQDRMIDLTPIKGKDSSAYLSCLLKYSASFNIPKYVRTDNGMEFTNNLVKDFNKMMNVFATNLTMIKVIFLVQTRHYGA